MKIDTYEDLMSIVKRISGKYNIYIWGIGVYGTPLGKIFNENNIEWDGYVDNFCVTDQLINQKEVHKSMDLEYDDNSVFVLSMKNYEPVKKQLNERNIDDNKIICIEKNEVFEKIETFASSEKYDGTKIKAFYNIHRDERCFIIGNGPSLLIEDLKKIQSMHDASFACNMIFNCFDKTVWRPDYYFMIDYIGLREVFGNIDGVDKIKYVSNNCRQIFTRYGSEMDKFKDIVNNISYLNLIFPETLDNFMFSEDCSLYIYMGYTVSYIMIQLAVYMGFKEIFLLGMDHSYSKFTGTEDDGTKKDHADFLGKYNLWGNYKQMVDYGTVAYMSAKKYADEHEINIFNATRGGKLEVFPRIDFDRLF